MTGQNRMTTLWVGEPLQPESYDPGTLVPLAKEARKRTVEFEWAFSREDLERLRVAVHHWGRPVTGRYKKFDAQVLAAINDLLAEPNSVYTLNFPKNAAAVDSHVEAHREGEFFRLSGKANFDVIFGYGWSAVSEDEGVRNRLGDRLRSALREAVDQLGWELDRVTGLPTVVNVLFGFPVGHGLEDRERETGPVTSEMRVVFEGPFHWNSGQDCPWLFDSRVESAKGIYLWTLRIGEVEYAHYVGQTGVSFATRLADHLAHHLSGRYNLLDPRELRNGRQQNLWGGASGGAAYGRALPEFMRRLDALAPRIRELLALYRFHLAVINDKKDRDRVEGALGRYFRDHADEGIRRLFTPGAAFPAAVPGAERTRYRLEGGDGVWGFPPELTA